METTTDTKSRPENALELDDSDLMLLRKPVIRGLNIGDTLTRTSLVTPVICRLTSWIERCGYFVGDNLEAFRSRSSP